MSQALPLIAGPLPGVKARAIIERDAKSLSPSYTRSYPLVADRGEGAIVVDVDGNRFLDCNAGIAVVATGHCHPRVVRAIQDQAARLLRKFGDGGGRGGAETGSVSHRAAPVHRVHGGVPWADDGSAVADGEQ